VLALIALVSALHGNGQRLVNIELKDLPIAMEVCSPLCPFCLLAKIYSSS
jgi:hypothetical protein